MKLEVLIDALELLVDERKKHNSVSNSSYEYDELQNIVAEILDTIYQFAQINELDKKFRHAMTLDMHMLEKAVKLIEKAKPREAKLKNDSIVNPKVILDNLHKFICSYKENNIPKMNAVDYIETFCDAPFDRLLSLFNGNEQIFKKLRDLLSKKLEAFDDGAVLLLWAKIKGCFGNDEKTAAYKIYDDIFPKYFFGSSNKMKVRDKCAEVLVKYKPLTIRRMYEEGVTNFPIILPGVPRLLTLTDTSDISQIRVIESLLVRSLSQIVAAYVCIVGETEAKESLAKMINSDPSGFIFDGDYYHEYKNSIGNKTQEIDRYQTLFFNIKRSFKYMSAISESRARIESVLRQYKMGQEIIHPSRKEEFKKQNKKLEVFLQKDLSKFFLERNILAFGKTMGRGIIDLYHKDVGGEDFVIEAKVYKNKKGITKKNLNKNVVQLRSYMDQHDQPRGILALFNFTDTLMLASRKWLKGRILIICINLCDDTPSKRKSSLEIIETEKGGIEIISVKD